jgi:hypothetical protein
MRDALGRLADNDISTPCQEKPVRYADIAQTPEEARELCEGCPVLMLCRPLGFTESVYADNMVYGGLTWRRGRPVSETKVSAKKKTAKQADVITTLAV